MKNYPGVSMYKVRYTLRRGIHKGRINTYTRFKSRICINGKNKNLGTFSTANQAAAAYRKEREMRGMA